MVAIIKLKKRVFVRMEKRFGKPLRCSRCGRLIRVGETVARGGRLKKWLECKQCWESRFYEYKEKKQEEIMLPFLLNLKEVIVEWQGRKRR